MKRIISVLQCFLMIILLFTSCNKHQKNTVEYPKKFTVEYCIDNYITADPNLIYLVSADNEIGPFDVPGGSARYRAIMGVPVDDYLLLDQSILFAPFSYEIVKNKHNTDLPQQEILSYKVKSILIYSSSNPDTTDKKVLGEKMVGEVVATIDGSEATAFQDHIKNCIETENYINGETVACTDLKTVDKIKVRFVFEKYENLVWDSHLEKQNDTYYILFYTPTDSPEGEWKHHWILLNQEFQELFKERGL